MAQNCIVVKDTSNWEEITQAPSLTFPYRRYNTHYNNLTACVMNKVVISTNSSVPYS